MNKHAKGKGEIITITTTVHRTDCHCVPVTVVHVFSALAHVTFHPRNSLMEILLSPPCFMYEGAES